MLVLSRKRNESIFIDDNVVVRVLSIHGSRVRLGIEADTGAGAIPQTDRPVGLAQPRGHNNFHRDRASGLSRRRRWLWKVTARSVTRP